MAPKTISVQIPDGHVNSAWEVALLLPEQGQWSEDDYLWLTDHTKCLVELTDGHLEVLPMPTDQHQRIVLFLYRALYAYLASRGMGMVLVAPLRLLLDTGRYREPDVLVLLSADDSRRSTRFWTGADLVIEVVSPDNPQRDVVRKRQEYAATKMAVQAMADLLVHKLGIDDTDAAMLIACATDVRTGLAGNPPYTMRVAVPRSMLEL